MNALRKVASVVSQRASKVGKPKLILLREERDRFNAMRAIQSDTLRFKRWYALSISLAAFVLLWCCGAVVFWQCEKEAQQMTYFQALYFCYVSLLTIGYGDLAPKSNPGRPFFILWSLFAVPTMTILVADLSETVVSKFKQGTFTLADFTVLPKHGVWRNFLEKHPLLFNWVQGRKERKDAKNRLEEGFQVGPGGADGATQEFGAGAPTIEELAKDEPSHEELDCGGRRISTAWRKNLRYCNGRG